MSRQIGAVAEKILLTPANVVRGLPVKSAATELAVKQPGEYGKLGWHNWWPPEYSKKPNPRLPPYPYTMGAKMRVFPHQFYWEHVPLQRFVFYGAFITFCLMVWFDRKVMLKPENKKVLVEMVTDDLKAQRKALYAHLQNHEDHHYFRHKGCHEGHPLGHGVQDPHVF